MGLPERTDPAGDTVRDVDGARRLALLRPIVAYDVERLKRLQDRMRDTRDP